MIEIDPRQLSAALFVVAILLGCVGLVVASLRMRRQTRERRAITRQLDAMARERQAEIDGRRRQVDELLAEYHSRPTVPWPDGGEAA